MDEAVWMAAVLRLPAELEEPFIGLLADRSTGAISTPADDCVHLKVFLRSDATPDAMEEAERFITENGLDAAHCRLHIEQVDDDRWVERFQASLKPFTLGERFMVYPSGRVTGDSSRIPLSLLPGRAFGTGEHPTTRLCSEKLERLVLPGERWLDIGCGTAILAIVARHCGAGEILAIDDDAEAVEVAAGVLKANGLSGSIALECGSIQGRSGERWDGLVANIGCPYLVSNAEVLAAMLAPGGRLICSGFLADDVEEVGGALAGCGLEIAESKTSAEWAVLVAMKPDRSSR